MKPSFSQESNVVLLWFRQDLRLRDNPALADAVRRGCRVIPVFLFEESDGGPFLPLGAASKAWLHQSLTVLGRDLDKFGSRLILRRGRPSEILPKLLEESGAGAVAWNRRYDPAGVATDAGLKEALGREGYRVRSHNASLLWEPQSVRNKSGSPFRVFTPFWKHCQTLEVEPAGGLPEAIPSPDRWPGSDDLASWGLLPSPRWDVPFWEEWVPGESGAAARLDAWAGGLAAGYGQRRDLPAEEGTSRLSPHLHWGEIGPRQIWAALRAAEKSGGNGRAGIGAYLRELGWREFAHHILFHFPETIAQPLRPGFAQFPWQRDADLLRRWQEGRTGYPIVDAGMRQLWRTGWMHNRVRMIAASFLVKHLLLHWRDGAAWFWDTLVDADLANNTLGWQWTAGCGADAAPYFRIFNPMLQGTRFDPKGAYVKRWVPELAGLSAQWVHQPWMASKDDLRGAGVELGVDYPWPVIDHGEGRQRALEAYGQIKND